MYKSILAASAVALAISACGTSAAPSSAPATGNNRPAATSTTTSTPSTPSESSTETPTPTSSDSTAAFGGSFKWKDGLSVTVAKPVAFKPGQYSARQPAKAYVKITVTIVNGTGKVFDPGLFTSSVQSANEEASTVFDSAANLGGSPNTKLLAGRESKFSLGFGVADPNDLVMEVRPSFEHESVLFH